MVRNAAAPALPTRRRAPVQGSQAAGRRIRRTVLA
jgi:hypothetical protein